uniref:Probable ATP-dependent transporter ycf16 n=1 Tax=Cyanidium sp. THAL103 TaxID=3027999 RepID=A0A9Y1I475_9RHOD|nr:sulfate ABC transporter protein [Cyanidium sp. THAL103]
MKICECNYILKIHDVTAEINNTIIIKKLNLTIKPGETHIIMGPNGSGKSTLSKLITGHPLCRLIRGIITFNDINISNMSPNERSQAGIFLGFQYPIELNGVNNIDFLRSIYNSRRKYLNLESVDPLSFIEIIKPKLELINMNLKFLERNVNEGFSGGEKKKNEILQMMILDPKLIILDEIDSGLDIDALKLIANTINSNKTKQNSFLIITHYKRLLDYIKPDFIHIMINGNILETGGINLVEKLENKGYNQVYL